MKCYWESVDFSSSLRFISYAAQKPRWDKSDYQRLYDVKEAARKKSELFEATPSDLGFVNAVLIFSAAKRVFILTEVIKKLVKIRAFRKGMDMHKKVVVLSASRFLCNTVATRL